MTFTVGQTVILHDGNRRSDPDVKATVIRVGRLYGYCKVAESGLEYRFDLETGYGEYARHVYTEEGFAQYQLSNKILTKLRDVNLRSLPVERLRAIADALGVE